jgi:hypothetical protein
MARAAVWRPEDTKAGKMLNLKKGGGVNSRIKKLVPKKNNWLYMKKGGKVRRGRRGR